MTEKKYKYLEKITTVLLGISIVFVIYVMTQTMNNGYVSINGYSMFKVVTGSMAPTIPVDSLLISDDVSIDQIKINDIICFESTNPIMLGEIVTHRVIAIDEVDGIVRLTTKGDANTIEDTLYVTESNLIGKVVWYSQEEDILAKMVSFLSGSIGFLGCIVFPILIVSTVMLRESIKSIKTELNYLKTIEKNSVENNYIYEADEETIQRLRAEIRKELGLDEE